jgi:cysteine-rich repeat protein
VITHGACINGNCEQIPGPGQDQCQDNGACTVSFHNECENNQCVSKVGPGVDLCTTDAGCASVHAICFGNQCVIAPGSGTDQCVNSSNCENVEHLECENDQCVLKPGPGSNICAADEDCLVVHAACFGNQCTNIPGPGLDQCQSSEDCAKPQHLECFQGACTIRIGPGEDSCLRDTDCHITHSVCIGKSCSPIPGPGTDQCSDDEDCVGDTYRACLNNQCIEFNGAGKDTCSQDSECQTATHAACFGNQCIRTPGAGVDQCSTSADCATVSHLTCDSGRCIETPGPGTNLCGIDSDCTQTHTACFGDQCIVVPGPGVNQCETVADCTATTHRECQNNQCVSVTGPGNDLCENDSNCVSTHAVCFGNQCVALPGAGANSCTNSADCSPQTHGAASEPPTQEPGDLLTQGQGEVDICGDGLRTGEEECDDGNRDNLDGCSAYCQYEVGFCGDGILQELLGEQCEPLLHNPALPYRCSVTCRFISTECGDAILDAGEECDKGDQNSNFPNAPCRTDCSLPRCGDAILDAGEECDDGNKRLGDSCDLHCRVESAQRHPLPFLDRDTPPSFTPSLTPSYESPVLSEVEVDEHCPVCISPNIEGFGAFQDIDIGTVLCDTRNASNDCDDIPTNTCVRSDFSRREHPFCTAEEIYQSVPAGVSAHISSAQCAVQCRFGHVKEFAVYEENALRAQLSGGGRCIPHTMIVVNPGECAYENKPSCETNIQGDNVYESLFACCREHTDALGCTNAIREQEKDIRSPLTRPLAFPPSQRPDQPFIPQRDGRISYSDGRYVYRRVDDFEAIPTSPQTGPAAIAIIAIGAGAGLAWTRRRKK